MSIDIAVQSENLLIASLTATDRRKLLAHCACVDLSIADVLSVPKEKLRRVYFPIDSVISLSVSKELHAKFEVRLIGREGMLGVALTLGVDVAPLYALVQVPGMALSIDTPAFRRQVAQSPSLRRELKHYLLVIVSQLAQSAVCNRFHLTESRLARWLLMTHDRTSTDDFHVTHEGLANILGVRRVGITKAATALQDRRLISYSRGHITIIDPVGLQSVSCGCYQADKSIYASIMRRPMNVSASE